MRQQWRKERIESDNIEWSLLIHAAAVRLRRGREGKEHRGRGDGMAECFNQAENVSEQKFFKPRAHPEMTKNAVK